MVSELNIKFNFRVTWIEVNSKTARRTSASNCRFRDEKEVPSPDILEATTYICAYLLPTTAPKERTSQDSLEENIVPGHRQLFLKTDNDAEVTKTQRKALHIDRRCSHHKSIAILTQPCSKYVALCPRKLSSKTISPDRGKQRSDDYIVSANREGWPAKERCRATHS